VCRRCTGRRRRRRRIDRRLKCSETVADDGRPAVGLAETEDVYLLDYLSYFISTPAVWERRQGSLV
jgi:hypothetical protein